jgi:hypothetical protein
LYKHFLHSCLRLKNKPINCIHTAVTSASFLITFCYKHKHLGVLTLRPTLPFIPGASRPCPLKSRSFAAPFCESANAPVHCFPYFKYNIW